MFIALKNGKPRRGLEERTALGLVLASLIAAPPNCAEGDWSQRAINMVLLRSKEIAIL